MLVIIWAVDVISKPTAQRYGHDFELWTNFIVFDLTSREWVRQGNFRYWRAHITSIKEQTYGQFDSDYLVTALIQLLEEVTRVSTLGLLIVR